MCPITHTCILALVTAVVASFIFGYLWYGPLFGKTWAHLMGLKMDGNCKPKASAFVLTLLGTVLTTFVFAYILHAAAFPCNFSAAFFIWIGFYLPLLFSSVAWEGKPLKLFAINAVYYLLNLQLIAAVVTYLK